MADCVQIHLERTVDHVTNVSFKLNGAVMHSLDTRQESFFNEMAGAP
jgi:hypothetical protein